MLPVINLTFDKRKIQILWEADSDLGPVGRVGGSIYLAMSKTSHLHLRKLTWNPKKLVVCACFSFFKGPFSGSSR